MAAKAEKHKLAIQLVSESNSPSNDRELVMVTARLWPTDVLLKFLQAL